MIKLNRGYGGLILYKGPCHWSKTQWAWWTLNRGCLCNDAEPPRWPWLTLKVFRLFSGLG